MEEVSNEKQVVKEDRNMNEENVLNEILGSEKNISNNYSISVNEMSNKYLYKKVLNMLNESKNMTRELYNLAFEKGWYSLKCEDELEIEKVHSTYNNKKKELS